MSSSCSIDPPKWNPDNKDFAMWLKQCELWREVTKENKTLKDKHAMVLICKLPDDCEIKQLLFDQLSIDEMKGDGGWDTTTKVFKEHFEKDVMARSFQV